MRIVYFLLAHKNPEQVSRLIDRLYSPSDYFYIHRDKRKPRRGWERISEEHPGGNVVLTSKLRTPSGTFSIVEATLDGMNWCSSRDYDYFVFLSGQCYPIKPMNMIHAELEELERKNAAYMEYFKLPSIHWIEENGGLDRIDYFWIDRILSRFDVRMPWIRKTLPYNLEPYGGSCYFCLPKRFVDYIVTYVSSHPDIVSFYRYSRIPDEMFFQTIILNSPLRSDIVNDHKRYFRWLPGGHTAILRAPDLGALVASDRLFAKKFDTNVDSHILDLLDREIHGVH